MMPEEGLNPEQNEQETHNQTNQEVSSVDEGQEEATADSGSGAETVNESAPTEESSTPEVEDSPVEEESIDAEAANENSNEPVEETETTTPEKEAEPAAEVEPAAEGESTEASEETADLKESKLNQMSEDEIGGAKEGVKFPGEEPAGDEQAISFLEEIIGDAENFESVVDKANPNELALLLERISERDDISEFITKVGLIKGSFDQKTDQDSIEKGLLERFSTALARFNKKRSAYYANREAEKGENSAKKYALLERLKVIVQEEQVTKIQEVREIQKEWREIGWVMQKDVQPLKETYKQYLDIYYNLRSKYQELLELDREYNLKAKEEIIQKIEALIPGEEGTRELWKERSASVKELQGEWRSTGHVPREKIEEINSSYRNVLDRFYEMRSGYYEIQDQQKGENAEKKKALLEQLQVYSGFNSDRAKDWNEATKAVLEVQEKWKTIGPGPIDLNKQLWKDYRSLCDAFFSAKGKFFKEFDAIRSQNLAKKTEICEKAESLKDSENFRETSQVLKDLQKEWKTIGPVHERYSNKIWKRFRRACDHFFDRRSKALDSEKSEYQQNLEIKEKLIEELRSLAASEDAAARQDEFNDIQTRWKSTGHVPFRLKDKVNNAFKEAIGDFFDKTRGRGRGGYGRGRGRGQSNYSRESLSKISDGDVRTNRIDGEIRKLQSRIRVIQEKVDQYELNIQYISKGKSGDALRKQIQGQIDSEKARIQEMKAQVKDLRKLRDNPEPEKKEEPKAEEPKAEAPAEEAKAEEPAAEAPTEEAKAEAPAEEAKAEEPAAEEAKAEEPAAEEPAASEESVSDDSEKE